MNEAILNHVRSIDEKLNRKECIKQFNFMVTYKCTYEPPTNTAVFTYKFERSIELPSLDYEVALVDIETYYSFPNVSSDNNHLRFSTDGGNNWRVMVIPTGAYSIKALNTEINDQLSAAGHRNKIQIRGIEATLRCEMKISDGVTVDFTYPNSINTILGFDSDLYHGAAKYISRNDIDILSVNSIYINCDLITNSYVNGIPAPVIYSFFPNVAPGYKVVEKPYNLIYLPVNKTFINSVTVWLTDQKGNILNFKGQEISIRFSLRKCPN